MARKKSQLTCPMCGKAVEVEGTCEECKQLYAQAVEGCGYGEGNPEDTEEGGSENGISET